MPADQEEVINVEIEGKGMSQFPAGTDPSVIDMVVQRDFSLPRFPQSCLRSTWHLRNRARLTSFKR